MPLISYASKKLVSNSIASTFNPAFFHAIEISLFLYDPLFVSCHHWPCFIYLDQVCKAIWQQNLLFRFALIHKPICSAATKARFSITKIKTLSWTAEATKHRISLSMCCFTCVYKENYPPTVSKCFAFDTDLPQLSPTSHHHSHQEFSLKHLQYIAWFDQHVLPVPYLGWQAWLNIWKKAKAKILIVAWIRMKCYNFLVCKKHQDLKSSHQVTKASITWKNQLKTTESFLLFLYWSTLYTILTI